MGEPVETRRIRVRGQVQGVGFRPFVWQLARRMGLSGEVLNDPEGVLVLVRGVDLDGFEAALRAETPALARVDAVESRSDPPDFPSDLAPGAFRIAASRGRGAETRVTPDAATCPDCLAEIRDPAQRRFGHAFANCTHCGPRYSILHALPYDRAQTAMAGFAMCADCAAEYADPADRRFHAQPIACPACGPRLWLERGGQGQPGDAIAGAVAVLAAGGIVGVKGIGGFHLACDARNPVALALLRQRKRRPAKPLALMGTPAMIAAHAVVSPAAQALLASPAAPIVLLPCAGDPLPEAVAPGMVTLGWMLPATPLHHLLLDAFGGPLVMTSGNLSGEPQVIGNAEARDKLAGFCDAFLMHDRDILRRLDDGVERADPPMVLRRGRGRVPETFPLPPGFADAPQIVAFGGQMKAAICLMKSGAALLSHHLGDLDDALSVEEFHKACADYAHLFDHRPVLAACDLHPAFRSTSAAEATGLRLIRVQHHHAHLAACMGDAGWPRDGGPVAGIILDGLGLGSDGTVWGGEVLLGGYGAVDRVAHLRPAPLPGGDAAQAEPWRNALARLDQAGLPDEADRLFPDAPRALLRRAIATGLNAPASSSAGRLYDAGAAILGLAPPRQSFEGEAAMRLEAMADPDAEPLDFARIGGQIDPAPVIRALAAGEASPGLLAGGFQAGLARAFCAEARDLVREGRAEAVALSGGCFQNAGLMQACLRELEGLRVLVHRRIPPNDGGLAYGQALVAAALGLESL